MNSTLIDLKIKISQKQHFRKITGIETEHYYAFINFECISNPDVFTLNVSHKIKILEQGY